MVIELDFGWGVIAKTSFLVRSATAVAHLDGTRCGF